MSIAAISPNEVYVATVLIPGLITSTTQEQLRIALDRNFRIGIFSTITKQLHSTVHYIPSDNKSNNTLLLQEKNEANDVSYDNSAVFHKIIFLSDSLLGALWSNRLVVWDLDRGSIAYTISSNRQNHDKKKTKKTKSKEKRTTFFDAVAGVPYNDSELRTGNNRDILFVLAANIESSNKLYVQEYDLLNGEWIRKVKVGKIDASHGRDVSNIAKLALSTRFSRNNSRDNDNNNAIGSKTTKTIILTILSSGTGLRGYAILPKQQSTSAGVVGSDHDDDDENDDDEDYKKMFKISISKMMSLSSSMAPIPAPPTLQQHYPLQFVSLTLDASYCATVSQGRIVLMHIRFDDNNSTSSNNLTILQGNTIPVTTSLSSIVLRRQAHNETSSSLQQQLLLALNNHSLYEIRIDITSYSYHIVNKIEIHIDPNLYQCHLLMLSQQQQSTIRNINSSRIMIPQLVGIVTNSKNQYQYQVLNAHNIYTTMNKKCVLSIDWMDDSKKLMHYDEKLTDTLSMKRKWENVNSTEITRVLGPGQVGGEAKRVTEVDFVNNYDDVEKDDDSKKVSYDPDLVDRWSALQELLDDEETQESSLKKQYKYERAVDSENDDDNEEENDEWKSVDHPMNRSNYSMFIRNLRQALQNKDSSTKDVIKILSSICPDQDLIQQIIEDHLVLHEIAMLHNHLMTFLQKNLLVVPSPSSSNFLEHDNKKVKVDRTPTKDIDSMESNEKFNLLHLCWWITGIIRCSDVSTKQQQYQLNETLVQQLSTYYPDLLKMNGKQLHWQNIIVANIKNTTTRM